MTLACVTLASALFAAASTEARSPRTAPEALRQATKHDRKARRCTKLRRRELRLARRAAKGARSRRSARRKRALRRKARVHRRRAKKYHSCTRRHRKAAVRLRRQAASLSRIRPPRRRPIPLGAALSWSEARADPRQSDTFLRYFDQLTPEDEMKWDSIHPGPFTWSFAAADEMIDWARSHGKRVRGHTLIWGNQNPDWLETAAWSRETLLLAMRNHIRTTMQHFKGRVVEWDVVNEAIDENGHWTDNAWYRTIGPEYVAYAFRYAHEADPDVHLYYNDQGLDLPDSPRSLAVLALLQELLDRGIPVQGVGMESHVSTKAHASQAQVGELMSKFRHLGLDVAITEMDVRTDAPGTPAQQQQAQRAVYGDYARACRLEPHCRSFTTWGVSDLYSWYGPEETPLLFDSDFKPKPAYFEVKDWIQTP